MIFYSNSKTDRTNTSFGEGFYLYSNKDLAVSLTDEENCEIMEYEIEDNALNKDNTIKLNIKEYIFFVLYNFGKLEMIANKDFYYRYASLKDNKDLILGPTMDPVIKECFDRFIRGYITDYTLVRLLEKHSLDTQVLVCGLDGRKRISLTGRTEVYKDSIIIAKISLDNFNNYRFQMVNLEIKKLSIQRKGLYFTEVIDEINRDNYNI